MKVTDGPVSQRMAGIGDAHWHFFLTAWSTAPADGPLEAMRPFVGPDAVYRPENGAADPGLMTAWSEMNHLADPKARLAAFSRMQTIALQKVYAQPFGALTQVQGLRTRVKGFVSFRIPRLFNVWLEP